MTWISKPPFGTQLDFTNPINNGLVGCWIFNEGSGSIVTDLSGNNNNGNLLGMSSPSTPTSGWNVGRNGQQTLAFDGLNDYINIPNSLSLNPTTAISISTWIYFNAPTINSSTVIRKDGSYLIGIDPGNILASFINTGVGWFTLYTLNSYSPNTWHHVALTFDVNAGTNNQKIYVDGILDNQTSNVSNIPSTTSPFQIGVQESTIRFYNGLNDEVRIWNRALTQSEISTLSNPSTTYSMFIGGSICPQLECFISII